MSNQINKFTHEQVWEMLNTYTFTAGNKEKTERWYPGIVFHVDGTFENTEKTVGLHSWKFAKDRVEFYDKNGRLTQFAIFKSAQANKDGFEIRLNFPNQSLDNYNLLFSDGLKKEREFLPVVFHEVHDVLVYQNSVSINYPYFYQMSQIKIDKHDKYILSFDVKVEDVFSFSENDAFFNISMFDERTELNLLAGNNRYFSMNFENLTSGKWKHIEKELNFENDYVVYGPFLVGQGKAEFREIKLHKVLSPSKRKG